MKILFLTAEFPYPVMNGRRMRTWALLESLCAEHEVSMMCFGRKDTLSSIPEECRKQFEQIWVVEEDFFLSDGEKHERSRLQRIKNILSAVPWEISKAYSEKFQNALNGVISSHQFDLVFARYVYMGIYVLKPEVYKRFPTIIDIDDIEYVKAQRRLGQERYPTAYGRLRARLNNTLFRIYHRRLRKATLNIVCSEDDKQRLKSECGLGNVEVIGNSIDVDTYKTVGPFTKAAFEAKSMLFCGNLNYAPNTDALGWFCNHILPLIAKSVPKATLQIVGLCKHEERMRRLIDGPSNIELHVNVDDVRPYYGEAALVIVPIRVAGGTRIKALEAMASRRPIVSTTIGVEGLGLESGQCCAVADSPEEFANACVRLLEDYESGLEMTERGLNFVTATYDGKSIGGKIRAVCRKAVELQNS